MALVCVAFLRASSIRPNYLRAVLPVHLAFVAKDTAAVGEAPDLLVTGLQADVWPCVLVLVEQRIHSNACEFGAPTSSLRMDASFQILTPSPTHTGEQLSE